MLPETGWEDITAVWGTIVSRCRGAGSDRFGKRKRSWCARIAGGGSTLMPFIPIGVCFWRRENMAGGYGWSLYPIDWRDRGHCHSAGCAAPQRYLRIRDRSLIGPDVGICYGHFNNARWLFTAFHSIRGLVLGVVILYEKRQDGPPPPNPG